MARIVAPGHKSIMLYYDKDYNPFILNALGGSNTSGSGAVALLLLSLIRTTEIRTDLQNEITEIGLQSFQNNYEAWSLDLNMGLFNLKNATQGSAETMLFRFIEKEQETINNMRKLDKT
ncbi:hypothetical protein JXQ70_09510 [bacterium]|nr:hypothetical protein [bacterium]